MKLINYKLIAGLIFLLLWLKLLIFNPRAGLIVAAAIPALILIVMLLRLAMRSHSNQVMTGEAGMIGMTGRAETALAPEGMVFVRGELWRAQSGISIAAGEQVRVVGVNGLTLEVELADKERAMLKRRSSFIDPHRSIGEKENE